MCVEGQVESLCKYLNDEIIEWLCDELEDFYVGVPVVLEAQTGQA